MDDDDDPPAIVRTFNFGGRMTLVEEGEAFALTVMDHRLHSFMAVRSYFWRPIPANSPTLAFALAPAPISRRKDKVCGGFRLKGIINNGGTLSGGVTLKLPIDSCDGVREVAEWMAKRSGLFCASFSLFPESGVTRVVHPAFHA